MSSRRADAWSEAQTESNAPAEAGTATLADAALTARRASATLRTERDESARTERENIAVSTRIE